LNLTLRLTIPKTDEFISPTIQRISQELKKK
jgi:hypothetical protein